MLPSARRAMSVSASASCAIFSTAQIFSSCEAISRTSRRLKLNRWQREIIVAGTLCGSVVANTRYTCAGGSSRVFSSALNACGVSMWTSSMMYILERLCEGA